MAGWALAGDRGRHVDPLGDAAAEGRAQRIAVAGQDRLGHHHARGARALGRALAPFAHALTSNRCSRRAWLDKSRRVAITLPRSGLSRRKTGRMASTGPAASEA